MYALLVASFMLIHYHSQIMLKIICKTLGKPNLPRGADLQTRPQTKGTRGRKRCILFSPRGVDTLYMCSRAVIARKLQRPRV